MYFRMPGYEKTSSIEQILDKEEFTLEELLDEDDIIQECRVNGRLVAFLKERSTVEQLIRYIIEPPEDHEDLKRCYKYPFTACEVLCCDCPFIDLVLNTLVKDMELMKLLFGLLDNNPPLNNKVAGYFGRVLVRVLQRKTTQLMQYLILRDNANLLQKLINHIDSSPIMDVLKRLVGADDQPAVSSDERWLVEKPIVPSLLSCLDCKYSSEVQANAAEILTAIAHTQPSPLAACLSNAECIDILFHHALSPTKQVIVSALNICIALLEPQRVIQKSLEGSSLEDASGRIQGDAVLAITKHVPELVKLLSNEQPEVVLETSFGLLAPPLGRTRLKIVELLAVMLRIGDGAADESIVQNGALSLCMELFRHYPFNNLLHYEVKEMIRAALSKQKSRLRVHLLDQCKLLDWIISLPIDITPEPRPSGDKAPIKRAPIRAGYLGHVTQLASMLEELVRELQQDLQASSDADTAHFIEGLKSHSGWQQYVAGTLKTRIELENTWACGRPATTEFTGLESDGDEFQTDMELEQRPGMQQALYHRYNPVDEPDDDDDYSQERVHAFTNGDAGTRDIIDGLAGMHLDEWRAGLGYDPESTREVLAVDGPGHYMADDSVVTETLHLDEIMEDDRVIFTTSDDDDFPLDNPEPLPSSPPAATHPSHPSFEAAFPLSFPLSSSEVETDEEDDGMEEPAP